jgi:hypothetical protein
MNLQLSLKKNWFKLTKSGEKKEDYREITPYWANRFLGQSQSFWKGYLRYSSSNKRCYGFKNQDSINYIISECKGFKKFETNTMTLGYPKASDKERILKLEHKGIEIRTGNPNWGAKEGVLYFVIKHGSFLE